MEENINLHAGTGEAHYPYLRRRKRETSGYCNNFYPPVPDYHGWT